MNDQQFRQFSIFLQDTDSIVQSVDKRQEAYYTFDKVFSYLSGKEWEEKNLVEAHQYSQEAVFQNIAEGYFRLGFIERAFFQYSKLIYEIWYEKTVESQNRLKKRIHKGTQLHQLASIYEVFNEPQKAWDYYLAGFIEDVVDGRDYVEHQGYRSLRRFDLPPNNLHLIAKEVKKLEGNVLFNPLLISEIFRKEFLIPTYDENKSIDYIRLSRTKDLWNKLKKIVEKMINRGSLLEDFSEMLLNCISGFIVRYKRAKAMKGKTFPEHDYDLIVYNSLSIFPEFGNYILVECKDWGENVGYEEIAKFLHKLHSRKCITGIIVATDGVVYDEFNPTLKRTFDQDGIAVLVIDQNDLEIVLNGMLSLSTLLRKKYEQIRFGLI